MVDWSGGNDTGPTPRQDAIWACIARDGRTQEPVYLRNRLVAEEWIVGSIEIERQAGRRVLLGFDFQFGYPAGFAEKITGSVSPFALWEWLEAEIEDAPRQNNRFIIAAQINLKWGAGKGPFWGNLLARDIEGLARNKNDYHNPFRERRAVEVQAQGTFTCWQLGGAGAVGSQTLMGLPVLSRLRRRFNAHVWPFEQLDSDVAFVEIWPSLMVKSTPEGHVRDAWQVTEVARTVSALSPDEMAEILEVDASEEGWIFGLGHEDMLHRAAQLPPRLNNSCFALPPGVDWAPVTDALKNLRDRLPSMTDIIELPVLQAAGHVTAEDILAQRSNPPLPNTAVDGYGFEGGRGEGVHSLPLAQHRAAAGDAPRVLSKDHAVRVLTGAALPHGVDTVVLQEDVTLNAGAIAFRGPLKQGANTRQAGEDIITGQVAVARGQKIYAPELALLSATGVRKVMVHRPLRVAVVSTGAELVEIGSVAQDGQIFDANRPMLLDMLRRFGHETVDVGIVPDDRPALAAALNRASDQADVILTSGGASAGDEDHVSALLSETGSMSLWRIAVKPGRPLALGVWRGKPVFGLPGNPVAAMVCTLIFARPAMAQLSGENWSEPQGFMVPAAFAKSKKPGRSEFLRARMHQGQVEIFASEGSGRISGLSWADGLVELPHEATTVTPGVPVRYIPFSSFGL
ncbi:MAG: gephyrin-like molybdotransferase Glp [Roseobacter sp.]